MYCYQMLETNKKKVLNSLWMWDSLGCMSQKKGGVGCPKEEKERGREGVELLFWYVGLLVLML